MLRTGYIVGLKSVVSKDGRTFNMLHIVAPSITDTVLGYDIFSVFLSGDVLAVIPPDVQFASLPGRACHFVSTYHAKETVFVLVDVSDPLGSLTFDFPLF